MKTFYTNMNALLISIIVYLSLTEPVLCCMQLFTVNMHPFFQFPAGSTMAYIRCQNYILLLIILLCDIDITFCNMHGLFGYLMSHYAIFILYYAT